MGAVRDTSRFLVVLSLAGVSYLLVAEGENFDDQWIAIGAFALGILAVVLIAYRFRADFQPEEE